MQGNLVALMIAVVALTGCAPPGARAVLDGKKLLERGENAQAIAELQTATELLPTNALAFNYLGLAFHRAGQPAEAERAYLRALALDHDLTEVHYDLGCLWLGQSNKLDQARSELTTYTLRRPNSAEGWLKLAEAQSKSRELTSAEKSLNEALRLEPHNPEVLTALGMARYQRKRANEAAQFFARALKEEPNYPPALLNLAIVAQQDLNDPRLALQKYREYLALKPAPENFPAVSATAHQLELELNPTPRREPGTNVVGQPSVHTNGLKAPLPELAHAVSVPKAPATNANRVTEPLKSDQPANVVKSSIPPTNAPKPAPLTNPTSGERFEVVKLGAEPVIKPAGDLANAPVSAQPQEAPSAAEQSSGASGSSEARPQKRGFLRRINPLNLFMRDGKAAPGSAPQTTVAANQSDGSTGAPTGNTRSDNSTATRRFPRYAYRAPQPPASGDRAAADQAFGQGVKDQQAGRLPEAIQAYRRAAQFDPSYYDAHYNLGLAAAENGSLPLAIAAYETALAIQPESLDARYNFGLVLKQAGYVLDAVTQFERILSKYPNDSRTHLALGNLYAQQLQEPAKARQHYLAVLEIAPQSPQAGAIRYWLSDHPK